jgi:hypothetical protein
VDFDAVLTPVLSALGGGTAVAGIAKIAIQKWFEKNEKNHERWGTLIQEIQISVTRIEERVLTLQRTEDRTRMQDQILAVLQTQMQEFKQDLNGVGRKVREMDTQ